MKYYAIILMLILTLASPVYAATEASNLEVTILGTDPFPAQPGQTVEINVRITNDGNSDADQVILELQDEYPITAVTKTFNLGLLPPGVSSTKRLEAIVAKDSPTGAVTLPVRVSPDGGLSWLEPDASITVRESNAALAVTSVGTIPRNIAPGQDGILQVKLRNDGSNTLTALEVELQEGDAPIVPIQGSNVRYINTLRPSETATVEFEIAATSNAESGNFAPQLSITYNDFSGATTKDFDIGIKIFEEPSYLLNIESREVYTGSDLGNVVFSLANTGTSVLKFTTLTVLPGDGYEVIDAESDYLGDLDPDDFQTSEFQLKLNTDAEDLVINTEVRFKDAFNHEVIERTPVTLKLFGDQEAILLGLKAQPNIIGAVFNIMLLSLAIIFWIIMLVDWKKNKNLSKDRRWAWLAILVFSNVLGAILYYFIGRKR